MGVTAAQVARAIAGAGGDEGTQAIGVRIAACETSDFGETTMNPSQHWGLFQFDRGTGGPAFENPDINVQARQFVEVYRKRGTQPWDASAHCWKASGGKADKAQNDAHVGSTGPLDTGPGVGGIPSPGDIGGALADAVKGALEKLLGMPLGEFGLRYVEVVGGAIILAVGVTTFAVVLARHSPTASAASQAGRSGGRTLQRAGRTVVCIGSGGTASAGSKLVGALVK